MSMLKAHQILAYSFTIFLTSFFCSCGLDNTETDRQEVLDRLRTLGVAAEPLVPQIPLDSEAPVLVVLSLHVATPTTTAVEVTPFRNPARKGANIVLLEQQIAIDATATTEQKIGSLRILTFKASVNVPSEKYWKGARGGTVQYGFKVSDGSRTEYVSGEFLAFRAGSAELGWKNPTLNLKYPENNSSVANGSNSEITMVISKSQNELIRPGWFVSSGEVEQRRSETTNWKPKQAGEQALIATARGADSLGFAIQVSKVNVP